MNVVPVGVFGGTFDPIHFGHLRTALELVEHLALDHLRLMPCAVPPHRAIPACDAEHRAAMVELAVRDEPRLRCDRRELERGGASYSIDSLAELRVELGPQRGLCLVMGCDAVAQITSWHRWDELLDLAHVVVVARPGWTLPESGEAANWLHRYRVADARQLRQGAAGGILVDEMRPLAISSTEIREMLGKGLSPRYLMPEQVLGYIQENRLYQ